MNTNYTRRFLAVLLAIFVLSPLLILPGAAQDASISDQVGDVIQGAVNDAVNDAIQDATDDLQDQANDMLSNISGVTNAFLSGDGFAAINEMIANLSPAFLIIVLMAALVLTLFGYRLLKLAITILGFTAGWILGMSAYAWLLNLGTIAALETAPTYVPYIVYAVFGLLCSLLAHKLFKTGIFIATTAGTFLFLSGISDLINPLVDLIYPDELSAKYLIAHVLLALLVGLLSRALARPVLIATTAAAGGTIAALVILQFIAPSADGNLIGMVLGIVLTITGIIVQAGAEKKHKKNT